MASINSVNGVRSVGDVEESQGVIGTTIGSANITTSNTLAGTATVSTQISRGLPFRVSAGGLVFTGRFGKRKEHSAATATPTGLNNAKAVADPLQQQWWGQEYVPVMTNSILPFRKIGDESDVEAILKKCSNGGRALAEGKSRPDTIAALCGLDTALMEETGRFMVKSFTDNPTKAKDAIFKYRDLRVLRIQIPNITGSTSSLGDGTWWSIVKPLANVNTVKPYVVDSALFLSDIAILPIDITEIKTLDHLRRLLAAPTEKEVKLGESTSTFREAKSFATAPNSSLYNMLVRLQVNGGGVSNGAGGLLDTTIVVLVDRQIGVLGGAESRIVTFKKEILQTALEIRTKFRAATKTTSTCSCISVISADSITAAMPDLMAQMGVVRNNLESTRAEMATRLELNSGLKMQIMCSYVLKEKQEIVLCTRILSGSVAVGESVEIGPFPGVKDEDYENKHLRQDTGCWGPHAMSFSVTEKVLGIKHYDNFVSTAFAGQLVGLRITLKNFDAAGKLKIPLSWQSKKMGGDRTYSLHTGLMMTSVKWRSQGDVPVDVAIPAVDTFEVDAAEFGANVALLKDRWGSGRPYLVTCGAFEGRVKLEGSTAGSDILRFSTSMSPHEDSLFYVASKSATTTGGKQGIGNFEFEETPSTLGRVTISVGGLVLGSARVTSAKYRCRKVHSVDLTSVTMILRRVFPFELTSALLEYAHPDAMTPFGTTTLGAEKKASTLLAAQK